MYIYVRANINNRVFSMKLILFGDFKAKTLTFDISIEAYKIPDVLKT